MSMVVASKVRGVNLTYGRGKVPFDKASDESSLAAAVTCFVRRQASVSGASDVTLLPPPLNGIPFDFPVLNLYTPIGSKWQLFFDYAGDEHITAAIDSLTNIYPPDVNMAINMNGPDIDKPHSKALLTIIEQPQSRGFRFRYKCEGPSHGGLQGVKSEKGKKSYPTVQIMNYEGPARILVSLVTDDSIPKTHAHELVGKSCNKGICLMDVKEAKNPICQFQNIGVMHVTKRKVADVLKERILESMLLNKRICSGNVNDENIQLNDTEKKTAKEQADTQAKSMHLNVVRLCFQAYLQDKNGNLTIMLPSVISNPIYDSKSPGAAALKICRMDKCGGCCTGNEEVFLLCEKVQKDDIRVVFIEVDHDQKVIWKKEANFGPTDVHKQNKHICFLCIANPDEDGIEKKKRRKGVAPDN
ncbi:NFKB1 [Acanthosepion pharaonis]|uniref:NFKB1 n=1 Tax=Acanthosepion pharaonis TaxID=158019 RepID=A0A812E210_ACAPH|nr:NFKB1 [Sepia pharaonis]